jgi:hypothetical protein
LRSARSQLAKPSFVIQIGCLYVRVPGSFGCAFPEAVTVAGPGYPRRRE